MRTWCTRTCSHRAHTAASAPRRASSPWRAPSTSWQRSWVATRWSCASRTWCARAWPCPLTSAKWQTPAPWTAACSTAATCSAGKTSFPCATWATARCAPPALPCPCRVQASPASTWARSLSSSTTTGDTCCLSPRPTWARVATPSWPRWSPSIWNAPWMP